MPGHPPTRTTVIDAAVLRHVVTHPARRRPYTVRELAERVGVSRATVGHLLSGARSTVAGDTAAALAEAVGVPPQVLFTPWPSEETDTSKETP